LAAVARGQKRTAGFSETPPGGSTNFRLDINLQTELLRVCGTFSWGSRHEAGAKKVFRNSINDVN
jgi:hypothetical protein